MFSRSASIFHSENNKKKTSTFRLCGINELQTRQLIYPHESTHTHLKNFKRTLLSKQWRQSIFILEFVMFL